MLEFISQCRFTTVLIQAQMGSRVWNEMNLKINWSRLSSNSTLINRLKHAVKKFRYDVVKKSVEDRSKRMYKILHSDEEFLR
jgi:hypothetical protein